MKKGSGIAIALTLVSGITSIVMLFGSPKGLNERMVKELQGVNELTLQQLNDSIGFFNQRFGRDPHSALEMVPYPLREIPKEPFSKSSRLATAYDGLGGWIYVEGRGFSVNHPQSAKTANKMAPTPTPGPPATPMPDIAESLARETDQGYPGMPRAEQGE